MSARVTLVEHPVAAHWLAELRDRETPPERFRVAARRLAAVLVIEATRDLAAEATTIDTPLSTAPARRLGPVVAVPILRAGLGLLDAVTDLLPALGVGYAGLERDETTLEPSSYYLKVPELRDRTVLLLEPMLATGGSAAFACRLLLDRGAADLRLVCVVAAPEGVHRLTNEFPRVRIVTAAVDDGLDESGFIVPGLGDFGDRLFGT